MRRRMYPAGRSTPCVRTEYALRSLRRAAVLAGALAILTVGPAAAQVPGHSPGPWRTLETEHFTIHYPVELAEWSRQVSARLESVHAVVSGMIGNAPPRRITVIVDDPSNVSNGSMTPGPLLYLFPNPPDPRSMIGENRGWMELVAVHEYAHAAHLDRPSRNPRSQLLWSLLPIPLGPVHRNAPRWVTEGYATFIEGRVTGSGRPHGVWRPAVLRQRALEGRLPTYAALNGSRDFLGGSMAYLVGSAYLEWLVQREGEESLPNLWRRMSAWQQRTFNQAFTGVFGAPPDELYGEFVVELTLRADEARRRLEEAGLEDGELFQHLAWNTGDPTVSPDGRHLALRLSSASGEGRIVVIRTEPDTLTEAQRRAQERALERDPEDVPAVERRPRPQRPVATLHPSNGREYYAPVFMPDGKGILVVRSDGAGHGRVRPDLFLWNWETGAVRRITRGASVRWAHPAPDGRWAVGLRCERGSCDVVRIDLESGRVTTLAAGLTDRPFYRPRVSPDGTRIVASVQHAGRWRVALMDTAGGSLRYVDPEDGASRFDAAFLDEHTLVLTSTLGGIPNLERLDLRTGETRPLTRVTGAAVGPAPNRADGSVFFLSMHSRGYDLRRIHPDSVSLGDVVHLDPGLWPAAPPAPAPGVTIAAMPVGSDRAYGLGPRTYTWAPVATAAPEGKALGLVFGSTDPIGRFAWSVRGLAGSRGAWTGGAADVTWRGIRPHLTVGAFAAAQEPFAYAGLPALDSDYRGGFASLELRRDRLTDAQRLRLGASTGRVESGFSPDGDRDLAFGELAAGFVQGTGRRGLSESLRVLGASGRTAGADWSRAVAEATLAVRMGGPGIRATALFGAVNSDAPAFEAFAVGGMPNLLVDYALLSQRIPMPVLPVGMLRGSQVAVVRVELAGAFRPYFWAATTDADLGGWHRVLGAEYRIDEPRRPYARVPAFSAFAGFGYSLDSPFRDRTRLYGGMSVSP